MTYFRLEIDGKGGLFRNINSVLERIEDDETHIFNYEFLNRYVSELEYKLPVPPMSSLEDGICAYKDEAFHQNKEIIDSIGEILYDIGETLIIKEIFPTQILYEDELQIVAKV